MVATGRRCAGLHQQQITVSRSAHTLLAVGRQLTGGTDPALTIDAVPKNPRDEYSITLDWPYRGDRSMVPHQLALEIAQERGRQAESLAAIITLHKFFIDRFAVFMNNRPIKHVHRGEQRWNRATAAK
jgi:hypothetical protein